MKVINKSNDSLKFLYRKNRYLTPYLKRVLCNALIQPHFDYGGSAWCPNLNKKFNSKLQTIQSRCMKYCLQLNNRSHIGMKDFEKTNWLLCSNPFKFFKEPRLLYFHFFCLKGCLLCMWQFHNSHVSIEGSAYCLDCKNGIF